jgi:transcription elongation factor GreA
MKNLMTKEGFEDLSKKLKHLETTMRHSISKEIEIAREHGDISENAEYTYAKEKQGLNEGKIAQIREFLANAEVVTWDPSETIETVVFGSVVSLLNCDSEEKKAYRLVGETEADVKNGKINFKSPLARAALGKRIGDDFELEAPSGAQYWEILDIGF